jgi:non-lysosomal glucosylceramidase
MLNLCGSFGPFHMDIGGDDSLGSRWGSLRNSGFEQRFLSGAAFHVRIQTASRVTVRTLATEDVLAGWSALTPGVGQYVALFPKAWFVYEGLDLPVALKQFTPYVARDERLSSLPAGIFEIAADNPTDDTVEVSFMFSFPNAEFRLPTDQYAYTRKGLRSSIVYAPETIGVRLQAQHPDNVPETERTEWVIGAKGPAGSALSATEDWDAGGDGSDLMAVFSSSGRLPGAPVDPSGHALAGAVCVSFSLAPRERKAATFSLCWDFPIVQFRNPLNGTRWWKRYKQWYPGHYRGWGIAKDVLRESSSIERAVDSWWSRVADSDAHPAWLRCAALNELYYDVFGGVFWENGCIDKPKVFGARPGQHLYFTLETDAYRDCESFDVRHYETRHLLQLFPSIERDVLLAWADMVRADPVHRVPHDAGSPVDDPWFVVGQYSGTRPDEAPVSVDWLDIPAKFVQQAYAYWSYTGDDDFAGEIYPSLKSAMSHLLSRDHDGDSIPDAQGFCTTYDNIEMAGASTYVAALTVGACEAMAEMAKTFDSPEAVDYFGAAASAARGSAEALLWNAKDGYYLLDDRGPFGQLLMADALCGELYASAWGLTDVLDLGRMTQHMLLVHQLNVESVFDGRYGALNTADPAGKLAGSFQARSVWPGGTYFTSALMYRLSQATGREDLAQAALATAEAVYRITYEDETNAFWFDSPAEWMPQVPLRYRAPQYQRCRAAWELLVAVQDPFPPAWTPV